MQIDEFIYIQNGVNGKSGVGIQREKEREKDKDLKSFKYGFQYTI